MKDLIKDIALLKHVVPAEQAAALITDGMCVAMSGYAMAGYPKAVVEALLQRRANGEALSFRLLTGANVPALDEKLGAAGMITRRTPMIAGRGLAAQVNAGTVHYPEQQMCKMPRLLRSGSYGKIDVAIIEALGITEQGDLIPTTSVGLMHLLMEAADSIIIEINSAQSPKLRGLHDIYVPEAWPHTKPIPQVRTSQRIGAVSVPVDPAKIRAIVISEIPERAVPQAPGSTETVQIVHQLFNFVELESKKLGCSQLPPLQTGLGSLANTIARELRHASFKNLEFFCGGVGEPILELVAAGQADAVSTAGLEMSDRVDELLNHLPGLRDVLVIRNGEMLNNAELIGRLGIWALNTGLEIDIYGNVNASHIGGSRVVNGIGGGANFAQNAGLSIILLPSTGLAGKVSGIVPMVSHQDICEHDVDVLVTELGVADLRGLDDGERADAIISHCTGGAYREQLESYLYRARKQCGGHHPQLPEEAFGWHRRLREEGSMFGGLS